jgi:hypothetical protein
MKIGNMPFRAEFNPLQNPNTKSGNNRALNRTCFHDLAGSIGATKRQPNPAMRWAEMGYIVGAVPHRLTDSIVNSRSALPREQLTIRKANLYEGSGRQIGTLSMPRRCY